MLKTFSEKGKFRKICQRIKKIWKMTNKKPADHFVKKYFFNDIIFKKIVNFEKYADIFLLKKSNFVKKKLEAFS